MRESGLYNYTWKIVMTETTQSTQYEKKFRIQHVRISPFEVQGSKRIKITVFLDVLFTMSFIALPDIAWLFRWKIKLIAYGRHGWSQGVIFELITKGSELSLLVRYTSLQSLVQLNFVLSLLLISFFKSPLWGPILQAEFLFSKDDVEYLVVTTWSINNMLYLTMVGMIHW